MATQGITTVNFGSGALEATVTVTGQAGYTVGTNAAEGWPLATETIGGVADDSAWVEQLSVMVKNHITGTGFTLVVKPAVGMAYGTYNIGWVWN